MQVLNIGLDHPTRGVGMQLYQTLKHLRLWPQKVLAERVDDEKTFVVYLMTPIPPGHLSILAKDIEQDSIAYWDCTFGRGGLSGPNPGPYEPFDKAKFIF